MTKQPDVTHAFILGMVFVLIMYPIVVGIIWPAVNGAIKLVQGGLGW